jgi:hypothetical protein
LKRVSPYSPCPLVSPGKRNDKAPGSSQPCINTVPAAALARVPERGTEWFERVERLVRPRWLVPTRPGWISVVNGSVLLTTGLKTVAKLLPNLFGSGWCRSAAVAR